MKNIILGLCFLALLAGGGYYFTKSNNATSASASTQSQSSTSRSSIDEKPSVTLSVEKPKAAEPAPQPKSATQNAPEQPSQTEPQTANEPASQPTEQDANAPVATESVAQPANAEQAVAQNEPTQNAPTAAETQKADEPSAEAKEEPKAEDTKPAEADEPKTKTNDLQIDPSGAKINFISYKMPSKTKVPESGKPATFKSVEINFSKDSGSVAEILLNSTAKIDLNSIDTLKNPIRDNNVKNKFFAHLASQEVSAKIISVSGNNEAGQISLSLNLNSVEKSVPLKYEVKDGKLVAVGTIDLVEGNIFGTAEAFEKFASDPVIQGLHGKKSWSDIEIGFEIPVK